jgi:putative transposase
VVTVAPGTRESCESWGELLGDLRVRGLRCPRLVIGDGHLGIWGGLREVYPEAAEQRCWTHRILNILDTLPRSQHAAAKPLLTAIAYAPTRAAAEERQAAFEAWCRRHGYDQAAAAVGRDWDRFMTFYRFPREHWVHLRTTNLVESPLAALRLRTDAAKRFTRVANLTAVI